MKMSVFRMFKSCQNARLGRMYFIFTEQVILLILLLKRNAFNLQYISRSLLVPKEFFSTTFYPLIKGIIVLGSKLYHVN